MTTYDTFLFTGHGTSEVTGAFDPGAISGGLREYDLAKAITTAAKKYLERTNLVIHYDESNFNDLDLAGNTYSVKAGMTVHINAGGGTGTEIWVPCNEKVLTDDFTIINDISQLLGIPNRGVKSRDYNTGNSYKRTNGQLLVYTDYYKEIRDAWSRGISLAILEVGFIDSSDESKINSNIDGIGLLVAKYIASISGTSINTAPIINQYYRVIVGSFIEEVNAENRLVEVKKAGFDSFITTKIINSKTYYRVVCGSFGNKVNAQARVDELKKVGFDPFLEVYTK